MRLSIQVAFFHALIFCLTVLSTQSVYGQSNNKQQKKSFVVHSDILKALSKGYDIDAKQQRLGDVISLMADASNITFLIHESAVDNNMDEELLITKSLKDHTLGQVLQKVAKPHQCTITIRNEVVFLVSNDFARDNLELRVYDCRQLITDKMSGVRDHLFEQLQTSIAPDSWLEVGGRATISEFEGLLIIAQTFANHAKIQKQLQSLSNSMLSQRVSLKTAMPSPKMDESSNVIYQKLLKQSAFDYFEHQLIWIVDDLKKNHALELEIHGSAKARHLDERCLITLATTKISLLSMLLLITEPYDCTVAVKEGGVYLVKTGDDDALMNGKFDVSQIAGMNSQALLDSIIVSIDPDSWEDNGGLGKIRCEDGVLIVHQSLCNIFKTHELLQQLHELLVDE